MDYLLGLFSSSTIFQVRARWITMMVGGHNIPMRTTANMSTSDTQILYPKSIHNTMTQEKLATLFSVAVKKHQDLYDFMPLTLTDEDKLDDTNSLEMLITQTVHRNYEFEMQDVLQHILIVNPTDPNERSIIGVKNLYKNYTNLEITEVKASNRWYRRWAHTSERFKENLMLTQKFLANHCPQGLYEQVLTEYDNEGFKEEERGGPLFFILMINERLATTEDAAKVLKERIRNFSLKTIEGENVKKAKQLLLGVIHRLEKVNLPSDIFLLLISLEPTTSSMLELWRSSYPL
jgi:hypothetical protein